MTFNFATRKVHYWATVFVTLPALAIFGSGILLQVKKQVPWVQPKEQRGTGKVPTITFEQVLAACQSVPQTGVHDWGDISRVDVRPNRGLLKVTTKNNVEVQVDGATGGVLQVAYRRSDLIESVHDGSFFHEAAKLYLFLPASVILLLLLLTGVYLFWLPIGVRWRKRRTATAKTRA